MSLRLNDDAVYDYIADVFSPEDELLLSVRAVGESLVPGMQVSPVEGKLLHSLVKMVSARRVLEFGSFVGYSTIWMARAVPEDGQIISFERHPVHADHARNHAKASGLPITIIEGDALEHIAHVSGPFDVIFIDGEKKSYMKYLNAALPLLRQGGLMVADNTLLFGAVIGDAKQKISAEATEVMKAVNKYLGDSEDFTGIMVPTTEGLTIGIKR